MAQDELVTLEEFDHDNRVADLETEVEMLQDRIKNYIAKEAQKEEEVKACNDIIADRDKMIDKMRGKLKRLDAQNSELAEKLTAQHEEMQKQNNVLQNRNSSLQDQIEEMQFTINDKQREIDQVKNGWDKDVEAMQKTIDRYKASLEEAQAALDVEVGEREVVTKERDDLQDRVSAMIASNNQKVDEFNELGESNQNLQAKIKEAEENYNSLRREFFLLSGAVDGLLMVRNAQRMGDA